MKIALVGCGYQGAKFIPEIMELQQTGIVEFAGIADVDPRRLTQIAETYHPPCDGYTDHRALIGFADAAVIAVPNHLHFDVAKAWIEAGKDVLLEKPICQTSAEAEQLTALASKNGVRVVPGNIYQFSRLIKEIMTAKKELGVINGINMRWVTPVIQSERDLLLDLLPHVLDILFIITGEYPTEVSGAYDGFDIMKSHTTLTYSFKDWKARVEIGWFLPVKHRSIEIIGSKRWLHTDVARDLQFFWLTDPSTGKVEERWIPANNTMQDELRFFVSGRKNPHLLADAVSGLRLIEQTRSALRGE